MPPDPADEIVILDPVWLSLLQASARAGFLCHECKSTVSPEDVARLILIADDYARHQQRLQAAKNGFKEALEQAYRLVSRGYLPFSPSTPTRPGEPPTGPGSPSAN